MFCMVTLIASCIHIYAFGYMHDELHDVTDHEVTLADGQHLHRRGRFHRFFQYLSLFSFRMLGIVHRRQPGDGVRVLGTGGHLLLLPDRLLHRAAEREHGRQQGVHRQSRRRLRHDHRPDGALVDAGHVHLRRHERRRRQRVAGHLQPAPRQREQLQARPARRHDRLRSSRPSGGRRRSPRRAIRPLRSPRLVSRLRADTGQPWGHWLLFVAGRRHLLRLRRQERAVPAARVAARRDGRPDARLRPGPLGHDGRRRRVPGRPRSIRSSRPKCCW